jgi:hypothetical protein
MVDRQRVWRGPLLRFLQISVATWCRPDAAHDFSTTPDRQQWLPAARVVRLNPKGRAQTKKYRPALPVPEKFARLLENRELGCGLASPACARLLRLCRPSWVFRAIARRA